MLTLNIRPATSEDSTDIYHIRNAREVREQSHKPQEFSFESHHAWFLSSLKSDYRQLYVVVESKQIVGVVRFDVTGAEEALVSVFVSPAHWGKGVASFALSEGEKKLKERFAGVKHLNAHVLVDNSKSSQLFEKVGYQKNYIVLSKEVL
jgi:RimJ/RimL family protein N-acetyltransferase